MERSHLGLSTTRPLTLCIWSGHVHPVLSKRALSSWPTDGGFLYSQGSMEESKSTHLNQLVEYITSLLICAVTLSMLSKLLEAKR